MDQELKRQIIMEHYTHPKNRQKTIDKDYIKVNTANESCIDNIDIFIKINNDIIEDILFEGEACAISISSTSIMITNLIGMSITKALDFINNFEAMVDEQTFDKDTLKEAIVYEDIYKQSNRKNCALLPYKGIKEVLKNYIKNNS